MDLHQYLPPHAHHHVDRENHHMSTWTTPNGTWQVILSPHLGRTHVSGPGPISIIRAGGIDEDQVVALLRLLEAIDPAPTQAPEPIDNALLKMRLQQHLEQSPHAIFETFKMFIGCSEAAAVAINWLTEAGFEPAHLDPDGPATGLSATHSPETPHEGVPGPRNAQNGSQAVAEPNGGSRASVAVWFDPTDIPADTPKAETGEKTGLTSNDERTTGRAMGGTPHWAPSGYADFAAGWLDVTQEEFVAAQQDDLLQMVHWAAGILEKGIAGFGATSKHVPWCRSARQWLDTYADFRTGKLTARHFEKPDENSSAVGETTPAETGTKLDRGTRSCPRLKPHDRHNWTTTDRTRPEPAENLWNCPGGPDHHPLQCATTGGHNAHEWMSRGEKLWCTGNPRKEN